MADLYKVIYDANDGQPTKTVFVSATTLANAIAAAKTNDGKHKNTVSATVHMHNVVAGS